MAPCVYKNDLLTVAREQPGETKDLETDPTLQRNNSIQCPKCHNQGYVSCHLYPISSTVLLQVGCGELEVRSREMESGLMAILEQYSTKIRRGE